MKKQVKLSAIGIHVFGGGFSLGVKQAGFRILSHFEETKYGVSTVYKNWPKRKVYIGYKNWPIKKAKGKVDFLYSNPPCAIFSTAGIITTKGVDAWKTDPRLNYWLHAFKVFQVAQPKIFALESVCQAYTKGRQIIDQFTKKAITLGYSVRHVYIDAKWVGLPQSRKRFFFIAYRPNIPLQLRVNYQPPPTIRETIIDFPRKGQLYLVSQTPFGKTLAFCFKKAKPGEKIRQVFDSCKQIKKEKNSRGQIANRPSFLCSRLPLDTQMGAFVGNCYVHPIEPRWLNVNEMKAICGYPESWELAEKYTQWPSLLARAVLPPVGKWLGTRSRIAIRQERQKSDLVSVKFYDLRKPQIASVNITKEYI